MTGHSGFTGFAAALLSVALSVACSVDERMLVPAASAGTGGALANGGSTGLDEPAVGGAAGAALGPLPICDFGASTVAAGCDSLVANPGFATDTSGWDPEMPSVSMAWTMGDADGEISSGSLVVVDALSGAANGIADRGAAQCLPAVSGQHYGFAADVFIPDGQGAGIDGGTFNGSAALSIIFYMLSDCTGYSISSANSDASTQSGAWAHREGRTVAPEGAQSMSVRQHMR